MNFRRVGTDRTIVNMVGDMAISVEFDVCRLAEGLDLELITNTIHTSPLHNRVCRPPRDIQLLIKFLDGILLRLCMSRLQLRCICTL